MLVKLEEKFKMKGGNFLDFLQKSNLTVSLESKYCLEYQQTGTVFLNGAENLVENLVKICYLKELSSVVEKEFTRKFLNVFDNVTSWVKSPSILRHNNMYYVTFRIRIKNTNRAKITHRTIRKGIPCWEHRCLSNFIYLKKFNQNFNPIQTGKIVAIPTPHGRIVGRNGAHDPRLFQLHGKLYKA